MTTENRGQEHEGCTKKALPAVANQQQEPEPTRLESDVLSLTPQDAYDLLGYLDDDSYTTDREHRLFERIRAHADKYIEAVNANVR